MWNLLSTSVELKGFGPAQPWQGYGMWSLESKPQNICELVESGESIGVIPSDFRPSALCLDVDATTIEEESLTPLAQFIDPETAQQIDKLTEQAMSGEEDFTSLLKNRIACFQGLPVHHTQSVSQALTLTNGIEDLITFFRSEKKPIFLISGGFSHIIDPIAKKLHVTDLACNHFLIEKDCIQGVQEPVLDGYGKKTAMESFIKDHNLNPNGIVAVGDGANDIDMLKFSSLAVGYRPKDILKPYLDVYNGSGDHRFLKSLLETIK